MKCYELVIDILVRWRLKLRIGSWAWPPSSFQSRGSLTSLGLEGDPPPNLSRTSCQTANSLSISMFERGSTGARATLQSDCWIYWNLQTVFDHHSSPHRAHCSIAQASQRSSSSHLHLLPPSNAPTPPPRPTKTATDLSFPRRVDPINLCINLNAISEMKRPF